MNLLRSKFVRREWLPDVDAIRTWLANEALL